MVCTHRQGLPLMSVETTNGWQLPSQNSNGARPRLGCLRKTTSKASAWGTASRCPLFSSACRMCNICGLRYSAAQTVHHLCGSRSGRLSEVACSDFCAQSKKRPFTICSANPRRWSSGAPVCPRSAAYTCVAANDRTRPSALLPYCRASQPAAVQNLLYCIGSPAIMEV
jgi:hypothetical protein